MMMTMMTMMTMTKTMIMVIRMLSALLMPISGVCQPARLLHL